MKGYEKNMTCRQSEFLLAAVIIVRATAYLFSKVALDTLEPFNLLSIRFILAAVILIPLVYKNLRSITFSTICHGAILGGVFFLTMGCEMTGLLTVDSSTMSFLENTAIVIVPLLEALLILRLPKPRIMASCMITMSGIGFLTLQDAGSSGFNTGHIFSLGAALFYAVSIIVTDRYSKQDDAMVLGWLQVAFIGIFSTIASFISETPQLPENTTTWAAILVLTLICTGFGFTLQPVAQKGTTAERAGLFCALNPLAASILGVLFLEEQMGVMSITGGVLVLAGIFLSGTMERPSD